MNKFKILIKNILDYDCRMHILYKNTHSIIIIKEISTHFY